MKISIRVVGKLKEEYFKKAEKEYLKRLGPMASIKILEFRDEKSLLKSIGANHTVVALDEKGHDFTSQQFAKDIIEKNQIYGRAPLDFVVGPADGHSESLRQRANHQICFGRMTLGHRMIRLVLLEQIYRAYKIIRGEPYHRG